MSEIVVNGAKVQCPFGNKPVVLRATSQTSCLIEGKVAATIYDVKPGVNLDTFGMCTSLQNPAVAAATAAAFGVLTPQPCTMVPVGTWSPVKPKLLVGGKPCLCSNATLNCAIGQGVITIASSGERKVTT